MAGKDPARETSRRAPRPTGPEPEPLRGVGGFPAILAGMWILVVAAALAGLYHLWVIMGIAAALAILSPFAALPARPADRLTPQDILSTPARGRLRRLPAGTVEVDETCIGGDEPGLRQFGLHAAPAEPPGIQAPAETAQIAT